MSNRQLWLLIRYALLMAGAPSSLWVLYHLARAASLGRFF